MPQSSLTAWLKKPDATQARKTSLAAKQKACLPEKDSAARDQLPTPPQSTSEDVNEPVTPRNLVPESALLHITPQASHPALPPNVQLRKCTKADIPALKRLNSLLLPIPYPDSFYREIIEDTLTSDITLLATWHDDPANREREKGRLVGAISGLRKDGPMLYLSTLVLLSPYRGHGIAARMLDVISKRAVEDYGISSVGAHVWEANLDGLEWYRKRGFKEVATEKHYYRRLEPSGATVVQRNVSVLNFVCE